MDVVIAGAHGNVARRLARLLADRADRVRGIVRNPDHRDDVMADGAQPILCDLETALDGELDAAVAGAQAIGSRPAPGRGAGPPASTRWTTGRPSASLMPPAGRMCGAT
jgi:uncharacterized protein YbjT (DUF2867 family)